MHLYRVAAISVIEYGNTFYCDACIIFVQLGFTALMAAAQEGHPEVVMKLISARAQIKARNQYGHTALYKAALNGQSECVSTLLKNGASPNSTDNVRLQS